MARNPWISLDSADRTHNPRGCPPLIHVVVVVAHHEPGARQLGTIDTFPDLTQPAAGQENLSLIDTAGPACHPTLPKSHEPVVQLPPLNSSPLVALLSSLMDVHQNSAA